LLYLLGELGHEGRKDSMIFLDLIDNNATKSTAISNMSMIINRKSFHSVGDAGDELHGQSYGVPKGGS
jgi:hypothetical protein